MARLLDIEVGLSPSRRGVACMGTLVVTGQEGETERESVQRNRGSIPVDQEKEKRAMEEVKEQQQKVRSLSILG